MNDHPNPCVFTSLNHVGLNKKDGKECYEKLPAESDMKDAPSYAMKKPGPFPKIHYRTLFLSRFTGELGTELRIDEDGFEEQKSLWIPFDFNGDGKIQKCIVETAVLEDPAMKCHKSTGCPEYLGLPGAADDRCALPGDQMGAWCRLMHGPDTHDPDE